MPICTFLFYSQQTAFKLHYMVHLNFPEHIYSIYILSPQTCSATCPAIMPTLMSWCYAARKHKFIMLPSWHCNHQPTADLYDKHSIFKNNTTFFSNHKWCKVIKVLSTFLIHIICSAISNLGSDDWINKSCYTHFTCKFLFLAH